MTNNKIYGEYHELIKEIVDEEVKKVLREANLFRALTGTVIQEHDNGQSYDVDIIDTKLSKVINKTGQKISNGSTVTIMERYGSNYANCYISIVNGNINNKLFDQSWSTDSSQNNSLSVDNNELKIKDANGKSYSVALTSE